MGYCYINFFDFSIYAAGWDSNWVDLDNFVWSWLTEVDSDDPYNLYRFDDEIEAIGIINHLDQAVLGRNWKKE